MVSNVGNVEITLVLDFSIVKLSEAMLLLEAISESYPEDQRFNEVASLVWEACEFSRDRTQSN